MGEHDEYQRGRLEAQAEDEASLIAVLHDLVDSGEPRLSVSYAHHIVAAMYGPELAKEEFGPDPEIENIVSGRFGKQ